ncbi:hypothetical protein ACQ4PT_022303 [Festuca glaucescens]
MKGCSKDPTFANGKNLVTYAVDLMGPNKSPEEYQSGPRILGTLISCFEQRKPAKFNGQRMLIRHLIGSSSSSHILQKLLQMLDSRSRPYDRMARECAATIVAFVADDIHLEQFPEELLCLSSLIETFEDWYVRDWYQQGRNESSDSGIDNPDLRENYVTLLSHGMLIFHKLASNGNNCRVISKTQGLLSKIMAPVTGDLLHRTDHPTWIKIVKLSLILMVRLVAAPGETGAKVREEISTDKETMGSMERILSCDKCKECDGLHIPVMEIFTQIYMDSKNIERNFIKMLVRIFTGDNEDSSSRKMAGEALAKLSLHSECSAGIILKAEDDVVDHLSKILIDLQLQNKAYIIGAAEILENLCSQYTTDDECLNELKIAMTAAIPKALGEIYYFCGLVGDETHTRTQPQLSDQGRLSDTDIENQRGHQQDNHQGNITSSSDPQNNEQGEDKNKNEEFQATSFSLCVTVCDKLISADTDLAYHFYANVPANGVSSFPRKLKDMVEKMSNPRPACLRMLKLTSMMVISMMKHKCSYPKQDLESLMESLSTASKDMFLLDGCMIFANGEDGAMRRKPLRRSLVSLVEEAQELVDKYEPHEIDVLASSTPVSGNTN